VKIVFKHNPLNFHNRAMPAALASMAAHKQGKFWEYHDILFANMRALNDPDLERYAQQLGLNMTQWNADRQDRGLRAQIENDQKAAVALGQGGTPAFFMNGKAISGAQLFEQFKIIIDAEIAAADQLIVAGTPLAGVHQKRA
jgi:protein-disulfide isomerase